MVKSSCSLAPPVYRSAFLLCVLAVCGELQPACGQFVYEMVTVADAGNAANTLGYGAVPYEYQIGKYEVTIGQYVDFLNSVAATDTYSLYSPHMATQLHVAGISRSGTSGSYNYSVIGPSGITPAGASSSGNRPVTYISWFDAARFANWMQNGQGSGSTETGAYTLNGAVSGTPPAKNDGAMFYIPTEDEWQKAAFYSPVKHGRGSPGYYAYASQNDTAPGNTIGSLANQANYLATVDGLDLFSVTQSPGYSWTQNYLTEAGAFTNSASYYGTFDQTGNVWEWKDVPNSFWYFDKASHWYSPSRYQPSQYTNSPLSEQDFIGFRLAASVPVPEPANYAVALAGLACGGYLIRRRQRA